MDKKNQIIKVYVSASEKNKITDNSKMHQLSVSEYAKKSLLKGPIFLNIVINDLLDYSWQIYETNCKIQELLSILNQSNKIDELFAANIITKLLNNINNNCNSALNINYKERKKIYHELEELLKNQTK